MVETLSALDDYGTLVWRQEKSSAPILDALATLANLKKMDSPSLAPTIHDVILSRLEWLSKPASAVLAAAAVIGRDYSFLRLQQVAGTDEQNSLDALDELLSARLITEARNEARPYIISHDRIRGVVYAQISAARRQIYHHRALTALALSDEMGAHRDVWGMSVEGCPRKLEPLYWMLGVVWQGLTDSRAEFLWEKARALLHERSEKIPNETTRQMFLENVPAHRVILKSS